MTPCLVRVSQTRPSSLSVQPWDRRWATQAFTVAAETTAASRSTSMRSGHSGRGDSTVPFRSSAMANFLPVGRVSSTNRLT